MELKQTDEMEFTPTDHMFRKFQMGKFDRRRMAAGVVVGIDIKMPRALELRAEKNATHPPLKISINHLFLKAVGNALAHFPRMYSFFNGKRVIPNDEIALNVPVDVENHVEYIIIRKPDRKSLDEIAADAEDQMGRIRAGEGDFRKRVALLLKIPQGVRRFFQRNTDLDIEFCRRFYGNFVLTNMGTLGADQCMLASAMPQPMIGVMTIGRMRPWPVEEQGQVVMRPHINACLTFDHRPIDGGMGARFAARIRANMESPEALFEG